MPCFVTGSAYGDAQLNYEEAAKEAREATRAACEMASLIRQHFSGRKSQLYFKLSPATQAWIRTHDKIDRERKKEEKKERAERKLEKRARAKLTKAERRALGIYEK